MHIYLEERIGKPELFTGRKRELAEFLTWIDRVKKRISKSTALLSRRKTGKSAILERLYNLTFEKHDQGVPFYFQIRETNQWIGKLAEEFFITLRKTAFNIAAFRTTSLTKSFAAAMPRILTPLSRKTRPTNTKPVLRRFRTNTTGCKARTTATKGHLPNWSSAISCALMPCLMLICFCPCCTICRMILPL